MAFIILRFYDLITGVSIDKSYFNGIATTDPLSIIKVWGLSLSPLHYDSTVPEFT